MTKKESVSCRSQDLSQIPVQTVSLSERMIGYNYLSKYNDWHDDFIISWHDKRIFLFEISKASDPTHARQGYNCRELEIVNDNNILMQTSLNFQLKQYFQTSWMFLVRRILLFLKNICICDPLVESSTGSRNIRASTIIKFWNFCFLTAADISEELFHRSGKFAASQLCCM
jgi:hypothetical protein